MIERLPVEVRQLTAQLRREGRTIRGIQFELEELGFRVSRSALGRDTRRLDTIEHATRRAGLAPVMAELRRIRLALEAIQGHLTGPKPTLQKAPVRSLRRGGCYRRPNQLRARARGKPDRPRRSGLRRFGLS